MPHALGREFGADPSPLTQMLHQRVLNGEIETAAASTLTHVVRLTPSGAAVPISPDHRVAPAQFPQRTLMPAPDEHFADIFVGREQETTLLESKLNLALKGRGDLIVLDGEAGVGKTRLAYHLLQQAADANATVISATCQALEQQLPFAPLADSLGRYLYGLPDAALERLPVAGLSQLAQIIPSLHDRISDVAISVNDGAMSADENRQRLIDSIVSFLAALSELRPLVFFLDDLHWADLDTLAVLSRLSQRVVKLPLLVLLAYRVDDLAENEGLSTLLHALKRSTPNGLIAVNRLSQQHVQRMVHLLTGRRDDMSMELADLLYSATQGNALFVTEALRDLLERQQLTGEVVLPAKHLLDAWSQENRRLLSLRRNRRVQEVILERIERLPAVAQDLLQVAAVMGRDFSLETLEAIAREDPLGGLQELLKRRFLIERPDERLDFSHQIVRQVAYDGLNALQRRRLHQRVANTLIQLGRAEGNPRETAFHLSQAGKSAQEPFAYYSVLAGEKLLRTYGFRQAIAHFDDALAVLELLHVDSSDLVRRTLQGRGLAYESLLDPEGVADTYRRLQNWATKQGDRELMLATHSRLTSMLRLLGRQRESNRLLGELFETLASTDSAAARSRVISDLLERRRLIYSLDTTAPDDTEWAPYVGPPPAVTNPVEDILQALEPVYAVLPLFDYGWTLLVQGQLGEATHCLEAVVDLANETAQPSIASTAYHQLAVTARILGDLEQSQALNDQSIFINREVPGTAAELASMWPRISSAFLSLRAGRWMKLNGVSAGLSSSSTGAMRFTTIGTAPISGWVWLH